MSDGECRYPSCSESVRGAEHARDAYAGRFCSARCEVRYDHVNADARDARRAAEAADE